MKVFSNINIFILLLFLISGCQRTLNWDLIGKGTLKDAQGICYPSVVHGTFLNGVTPGNDTSYVEVKVNVFTPGRYVIATDLQNGLKFSDEGAFTSTGVQFVKLRPSGQPLQHATTNFRLAFDTSICSFSIDVKDSTTIKDELNSWSYVNAQNNHLYRGIINASHLLISPPLTIVMLRQDITNTSDTTFDIGIVFSNGIEPGTYATDVINNVALSVRSICINCAWNVAYQLHGALTNIVVTSYDPQTKIIKGTFSGTTIDGDNNILPIKQGKFYAKVQ